MLPAIELELLHVESNRAREVSLVLDTGQGIAVHLHLLKIGYHSLAVLKDLFLRW